MRELWEETPCEHGEMGYCDELADYQKVEGGYHGIHCSGGSRRRVRIDYEAAHLKADEIGVRAIRPSIEYIVDAALITEEGT